MADQQTQQQTGQGIPDHVIFIGQALLVGAMMVASYFMAEFRQPAILSVGALLAGGYVYVRGK